MYAAVRGRKYTVQWGLAPRMIRMRLDFMRAVKNKLPAGKYVYYLCHTVDRDINTQLSMH
jgi:hypothetical protein